MLEIYVKDFLEYFYATWDLYKEETKRPTGVILLGIEIGNKVKEKVLL